NFAISNSIGAYAIFIGIGLLYARTGALNMAQIGAALNGHPADALVIVAMGLIFIGFLTKAAVIPVHFWLADAHAVAPTPVWVLFAIGGLLLAAIPPVTEFYGKSLLDGAAIEGHYQWLPAVFVIASMATGGAVLRVAAGVFGGWGRPWAGGAAGQVSPAREEHD